MKALTENEALHKAAAYCSAAERSPAEVVRKLALWGVADTVAARIMQRLHEERFLDEARFCRAFVHDKSRYNRWGREKIRLMLRQKGIKDELIDSALAEQLPDTYMADLRAMLEAKSRTIKAGSAYERRCKLIRFALSRGFEAEAIYPCLPTDTDDNE